MRSRDSDKKGAKPLFQGRDGLRLAIFVVAIAALASVMGGFDNLFVDKPTEVVPREIPIQEVPIPIIDSELVKKANDSTPDHRTILEPEIYEHLILRALELEPGSLRALGMAKEATSVFDLQSNPERFRGKPVWIEGYLDRFQKDSFPIPGLKKFRAVGVIETEKGEKVAFAVVTPKSDDIRDGTFVRISGFFFKLRSRSFPTKLDRAPFIIGSELLPAVKKMEAVRELDQELLAEIRDKDLETEASKLERRPLYHIGSYARNIPREQGWKSQYKELEQDDARAMLQVSGEVSRGAPFRILGALYEVRVIAAEPNPLGIDFWTYGWVEHPEAGTVEFRMPGRLPGKWGIEDYVVFYGHFLKRHYYETFPKDGGRHFKAVPLFVTADLSRWESLSNPEDVFMRIVLTAIALGLMALLSFLVIRDNRGDADVRQSLIERRRSRRLGSAMSKNSDS